MATHTDKVEKIPPSVAEHLAAMPDLLKQAGANVADSGIDSPAARAGFDERQSELDYQRERDPLFQDLVARIAELERRQHEQTLLTPEQREYQAQAARIFMEEENIKKALKRIREEQGGQAVVTIVHSENSAENMRPVTGAVNFKEWSIRRGEPTLCDVAVIERLFLARSLQWAPYVEEGAMGDQKKNRLEYTQRFPFAIQPPGSHYDAEAWVK